MHFWEPFQTVSATGWIAVATVIYALATAALAWFTNSASIRSVTAILESTKLQVAAEAENIKQQMIASAEGLKEQVASARDAAQIQARASSISNNRQQWINSLRDEVTWFLSEAEELHSLNNSSGKDAYQNEQIRKTTKSIRKRIFKVRLLLNPTEEPGNTLVEMLQEMVDNGDVTIPEQEKIVDHPQKILKRE